MRRFLGDDHMANDLDQIAKLAQEIVNASSQPVLVVGSGLSASYGVRGMHGLATHLTAEIKPKGDETTVWTEFCNTLNEVDLEQALQRVNMPDELHARVLQCTRDVIASDDLGVLRNIVNRQVRLSLAKLFTHMFNSTHRIIHVITTNYDRLIEYAADDAGFMHDTGFMPGYLQVRDAQWASVLKSSPHGPRIVEVAKVHGSVDWFVDKSRIVRALPNLPDSLDSLSPLIVTPGTRKYQDAYDEPYRSMIQRADACLKQASGFMCIGYGFNDQHIQPILLERSVQEQIPVIVLARTLTSAARDLIIKQCTGPYLAAERHENSTRIFTRDWPDGHIIGNCSLWDLDDFVDTLIN